MKILSLILVLLISNSAFCLNVMIEKVEIGILDNNNDKVCLTTVTNLENQQKLGIIEDIHTCFIARKHTNLIQKTVNLDDSYFATEEIGMPPAYSGLELVFSDF